MHSNGEYGLLVAVRNVWLLEVSHARRKVGFPARTQGEESTLSGLNPADESLNQVAAAVVPAWRDAPRR